eukprot:GDKJ01012490.1.p1 GENE.GDKJ01012490.1~~GDKJ01012490.1.p1  ORF type:complete len:175 (-),score=16.28 GDKJ01012490.1:39-563(-)
MNFNRVPGARGPRILISHDHEYKTIEGRKWYKLSMSISNAVFPANFEIENRSLALFQNPRTGILHLIDNNCYHAGGNLSKAHDIEEIANNACIRCPLHNYVISIESGEAFSQPVTFTKDASGKMIPHVQGWESQGQKQRVHDVQVDESGHIWVSLNLEGTIHSDKFVSMARCPR